MRVVERRALAGKIGQEQKAARARIIRRRFALERVRRRAEKPAGESQRAGAVEHRRHRVPAIRQRMGERMDELFGRAHVAVGRDDELGRGAEGNERLARRDRAEADRSDSRRRRRRRPKERRAAGRARRRPWAAIRPAGADPSTSGGAQAGSASQARNASADQARAASSRSHVPAASLMSVKSSPPSLRRK